LSGVGLEPMGGGFVAEARDDRLTFLRQSAGFLRGSGNSDPSRPQGAPR
jgi:hypothetical protein